MRRTVPRAILALLAIVALTGPAPQASECAPQKPSCCCPGGCGGSERSGTPDDLDRPCCGDASGVPVPEPAAVESPAPATTLDLPLHASPIDPAPVAPRPARADSSPPGSLSDPVPLFTLHASFLI